MPRHVTWLLMGGMVCLAALGMARCSSYDAQHQGIVYPPLPPASQLPASRPLHFFTLPVARYRLTDLGESILPDDGDKVALNNTGEVALTIGRKGYLWRNGRSVPLPANREVVVNALNDKGQCVGGDGGQETGAITTDPSNAVVWDHGQARSLGTLPDLSDAEAKGVNNQGQIVGTSAPDSNMEVPDDDDPSRAGIPPSPDYVHSFLWQNGRMADLGLAHATALNDAGQIVGKIVTMDGSYAALWERGQWHDLGSLPGWAGSIATDINSHGTVIGYAYDTLNEIPSEAFVWQSGRIRDLGRGHAWGINADGQIVGSSGGQAVLWWHGKVWELNACLRRPAGWALTSASGINDRGQIAGFGRKRGRDRFFLLTPINRG